jgi:hypothetical protein
VTVGVSYGGSPAMMRTPTGAVVLVEALGAVGFARAAKIRIFVYIANSFDFKSNLKFKKFPFAQ